MRTKLLALLVAAVAFLAASNGGSAMAQTYTFGDLNPSNTTTIFTNSMVTCSGTITISQGAPPPTNVKVTITDSGGTKYVGTGSATSQGGNTYNFIVAVSIPSTAKTGRAQCLYQGSTTGRRTWNAGSEQTTPTISSQ